MGGRFGFAQAKASPNLPVPYRHVTYMERRRPASDDPPSARLWQLLDNYENDDNSENNDNHI